MASAMRATSPPTLVMAMALRPSTPSTRWPRASATRSTSRPMRSIAWVDRRSAAWTWPDMSLTDRSTAPKRVWTVSSSLPAISPRADSKSRESSWASCSMRSSGRSPRASAACSRRSKSPNVASRPRMAPEVRASASSSRCTMRETTPSIMAWGGGAPASSIRSTRSPRPPSSAFSSVRLSRVRVSES